MNNIQGVLKMHIRDKWSWFYIPSIILFSSFAVNLIIGFIITINSGEVFYTGGLLSIFIYMLVMGIIALVQTFPYALGMSIRRKDYFIGTAITAGFASVVISILLLLFSSVENVTNGWGIQFHFFHLPYVNDGSAFQQLGIYMVLLLLLFFLGFTTMGVYRRFGRGGMFILAFVSVLATSALVLFATSFNWWQSIFLWVSSYTASELSLWLIPFVFFHVALSYALLRRATV